MKISIDKDENEYVSFPIKPFFLSGSYAESALPVKFGSAPAFTSVAIN